MPTSGSALTGVAISATLHCLTGCAIGEIAGMAIGTALGFSNLATIALAVALAFLFGYTLTSVPLLRAGLSIGAVIPIALASDTLSIATMEVVDNLVLVVIPGAMHAGLGDLLFWGSLSFALVVAGAVAVPVNRWLIARGKGHAVVHETGIHGGPSPRLVGVIAAVAAVFGTVVLTAEAINGGEEDHGGGHRAAQTQGATGGHGAGGAHGAEGAADPVRGLFPTSDGMTLQLATGHLQPGQAGLLRFQIIGPSGTPVRGYEIEHEKRMHLIVARSDLTGFQHLHPRLGADGTWSTPVTIDEPGSYRVFADFKRDGANQTLASDLTVDGATEQQPLPAPAGTATADGGYEISLGGAGSKAGRETALSFAITRAGKPVKTERYLGAGGHLVALREGDLAFLHVHPSEGGRRRAVRFETEFPTPDRYRLFLQFKHAGKVHTAAFTREVSR